MSYAKLVEFCQSSDVPISRKIIKNQVCELTGKQVTHLKTALDVTTCRGFFLSAGNKNERIVQQFGTNVVATARGLNRCWERFVLTKELMHLFGDDASANDTGDKFESSLSEINGPVGTPSTQTISEYEAFWMALGAFCPEGLREDLEKQRVASRIDDFTIATRLRIPQLYVPRLFEKRYKTIRDGLVAA